MQVFLFKIIYYICIVIIIKLLRMRTITVQLDDLDYQYLKKFSKKRIRKENISTAVRLLIDEERQRATEAIEVIDQQQIKG